MENCFILHYIDILNEMMDIDDDQQETNYLPIMNVEGMIETYNCEIGNILLEADKKEYTDDDKIKNDTERKKKDKSTIQKITIKFTVFLKKLINKIREYYKKVKMYIKKKIEQIVYGDKNESGSTKKAVKENTMPLVLKNFDYASGIRKLYSVLVPFIDGFNDYTTTLRGISLDKVIDSMGHRNMFTGEIRGETVKGDRLGAVKKYFLPLVEKDPAMICTNDEYKSKEEIHKDVVEVQRAFFGESDDKVSIQDYKYSKPIDNVKDELDKYLSNIDKLQKCAEKACADTEKAAETLMGDLSIRLFSASILDEERGGLIQVFAMFYKKAIDKLGVALSLQTSIISTLTRMMERATSEQLRVNRALKHRGEDYVPPRSAPKKPLQLTAPRESVDIDYVYEAIGENCEVLYEATSRDRIVMLGRKCQIICQKIMMFINKAITTIIQYVEKVVIKGSTILDRVLNERFKKQIAAGEVRAQIVYLPSLSLSKAMEECTNVMVDVVSNIEDFATVDVEADIIKGTEMKEVTPMTMALYKMDATSVTDLIDKLNKRTAFKEKKIMMDQKIFDKLALISGRELESSIKVIKSIEKDMKGRLDKVLSNITKLSKNKNLSNEGYNYCVRLTTACSIAFSVVQKCTSIMYKQFIKANAVFQLINSTYNKYDKAGAKEYKEKREKEEKSNGGATTESFNEYEYRRWMRDKMIKRI